MAITSIEANEEVRIDSFDGEWIRAVYVPTQRAICWAGKGQGSKIWQLMPRLDMSDPFEGILQDGHIEKIESMILNEAIRRLQLPGFRDSVICTVPAYCPKCGTQTSIDYKTSRWTCGAFCSEEQIWNDIPKGGA